MSNPNHWSDENEDLEVSPVSDETEFKAVMHNVLSGFMEARKTKGYTAEEYKHLSDFTARTVAYAGVLTLIETGRYEVRFEKGEPRIMLPTKESEGLDQQIVPEEAQGVWKEFKKFLATELVYMPKKSAKNAPARKKK